MKNQWTDRFQMREEINRLRVELARQQELVRLKEKQFNEGYQEAYKIIVGQQNEIKKLKDKANT